MRRESYVPIGVDVPLAGWGVRAVGAIVDGVIVGIPTYAIDAGARVHGRTGYLYLDLGVSFAYSFLLIGFWGRTLGMHLMRLDAVDAVDGRFPIGPFKAAVRSLAAAILSILPVVGPLADLLWPLWDPRNQTLHDKAAGTVVLRL
jgi:uncharacterized RDD family membrane protein YckC